MEKIASKVENDRIIIYIGLLLFVINSSFFHNIYVLHISAVIISLSFIYGVFLLVKYIGKDWIIKHKWASFMFFFGLLFSLVIIIEYLLIVFNIIEL
ncbi:hypothetical protein GGR21_003294 [Dysgonomonas hofstadii]|uniref:Uncharacterized protein n=1 Tax=Dysgonomonas hofstadii TaxID=637886 RepID=A0A840CMT0_9BACT|nr:hypothetical protein [Dysgonomonas hofstadii]